MAAQATDVAVCEGHPGFLCDWIYERTENESLAEFLAWLTDAPLRILLVIILAYALNRLLRASIERLIKEVSDRIGDRHIDVPTGTELTDSERARAVELRQRQSQLRQRIERTQQRTVTLGRVLRSVASVAIWTIAVILVLSELRLSLGPLLAGAGVAGLAIGFGAQQVVRDFLAGFFLIIEDQYGVGDIVNLGEAEGTVEEVTLRTTRLRDVNGALWVVPNGEIRRVANKSRLWARCVLDIEVAYDADIDRAAEIMQTIATELWHEHEATDRTILDEPEVWGVQALGDYGVSIRLALKTEPAEQYNVARELRRRLKKSFDAEGIAMPKRYGTWNQPG